jgi:hypothetical protein
MPSKFGRGKAGTGRVSYGTAAKARLVGHPPTGHNRRYKGFTPPEAPAEPTPVRFVRNQPRWAPVVWVLSAVAVALSWLVFLQMFANWIR